MNLPVSLRKNESRTPSVVTTDTILLLCGTLFGMCVSDAVDSRVKITFVLAGTVGLLAYLTFGVVKNLRLRSLQRCAMRQAEERLERHAHRGDSGLNMTAPKDVDVASIVN